MESLTLEASSKQNDSMIPQHYEIETAELNFLIFLKEFPVTWLRMDIMVNFTLFPCLKERIKLRYYNKLKVDYRKAF